jgi:1-pyrroline-5-carboxylate dehydrogenase
MYGAVCAKVAEEMRKPEVASFFAHLIQRTSPKSWPQAMTELVVTRRFFENFSGDQVRASDAVPRAERVQ